MKRFFAGTMVAFMLITALAISASISFGAEKQFQGQNLDIPGMLGWRCIKPVWDREALFTEKTGATWTVHEIPSMMMTGRQITELIAHTKSYDVISTWVNWTEQIFVPYMMPLNKFIERDYGSVEKFKEMFFPSAIDFFTHDGTVMFVPYHLNTQLFLYRKDLFEDPAEKRAFKAEYGYELQPPKTRQQIVEIAQFFTRPQENLWGLLIAGKASAGETVMADLMGAGFKLCDLDTGSTPFKSGAARKKAIETVSFWYDLIHKYKVSPPGTAAVKHVETYEMYRGGRAAMALHWFGDYWDLLNSSEVVEDIGETGCFLWPTVDPDEGIGMSNWGYGIPKDSKDPELAWEFIKFLVSKPVQLAMSKGSGQASPVQEVTEIAAQNGWTASTMPIQLKNAKNPQRIPQMNEIGMIYFQSASGLYANEMSPEEFIDFVTEQTEEVLRY